jgi:hypothetical protein
VVSRPLQPATQFAVAVHADGAGPHGVLGCIDERTKRLRSRPGLGLALKLLTARLFLALLPLELGPSPRGLNALAFFTFACLAITAPGLGHDEKARDKVVQLILKLAGSPISP